MACWKGTSLWNGDASFKLMWLDGEQWEELSTEFILVHISHDEISLVKANQAFKKKKGTERMKGFFCGRAVHHVLCYEMNLTVCSRL